jgi:hypothetical protein
MKMKRYRFPHDDFESPFDLVPQNLTPFPHLLPPHHRCLVAVFEVAAHVQVLI